jgi:aspartate racemase
MQFNEAQVIGIVGGMGPQAGEALLGKIIRYTHASTDQEHLPVALLSFPGQIVDRTAFLWGETTENPALSISRIILKLEDAGAKIIGIPCNTSHSPVIFNMILEELDRAGSRVRVLHMPLETCNSMKAMSVRRIGVMTTNGTYRTGLYRDLLRSLGYEVVLPGPGFQTEVIHRIIYDPYTGIKANTDRVTREARSLLGKAIAFFKEQKANALILGCTELSLAIQEEVIGDMLIIDSLDALAKALIRESLAGSVKVLNGNGAAEAGKK